MLHWCQTLLSGWGSFWNPGWSWSTPVCLVLAKLQTALRYQQMSKKCWNPPDSPQSWTLTVVFCHLVGVCASFILISHVCSHCEYFWTILRPLLGGFQCLPTVIFMTGVVLNVFSGVSLCLCGCFCIFGGLSSLDCNLAFLCNQCLWSVPFGVFLWLFSYFNVYFTNFCHHFTFLCRQSLLIHFYCLLLSCFYIFVAVS